MTSKLPQGLRDLIEASNRRQTGGRTSDPRRVKAGRKARAAGEATEAQFMAITRALYPDLRIRKRPTPTKRIGGRGGGRLKAGQFIAVYETRSGPDYDVHLGSGRPGGLLELKARADDRIALDAVEHEQMRELLDYHRAGLLAVIVVSLPAGWWVVRPDQWASPRGLATLTPADLDQVGQRCNIIRVIGSHAYGPDWFGAYHRTRPPETCERCGAARSWG